MNKQFKNVYGEPEEILPAVDIAPWETEVLPPDVEAEIIAENPAGTRYLPTSPDGFAIDMEHTTYAKPGEAFIALQNWCKRFKQQGCYRDGRGERIMYEDLFYQCGCTPVNESFNNEEEE